MIVVAFVFGMALAFFVGAFIGGVFGVWASEHDKQKKAQS